MHLKFTTAGESHGKGLLALIEGIPAGLEINADRDINPDLKRRQGGLKVVLLQKPFATVKLAPGLVRLDGTPGENGAQRQGESRSSHRAPPTHSNLKSRP